MHTQLTAFYRPRTVEEASALLASKTERNLLLAGGTTLAVLMEAKATGLIDLGQTGMSYIRKNKDGYAIGAMTPVADVAVAANLVGPAGSLLREAAGKIGSTLIRHSVTVGGNAVTAFPWADLPPVFLALDAKMVLQNRRAERILMADKFFATRPREQMAPAEILVEVRVPEFRKGTGTAFIKFAKTANDYSLCDVAVRVTLAGEKVDSVRIAVNAISRRPLRCLDAERSVMGIKVQQFDPAALAAKAVGEVDIPNDMRASREYRRALLPVLIERALREALVRAQA